jgi:chemotaxis protein methyltransferase CheR
VEGIFGEWSFRDAPSWLKEGYFREVGERRFEILPRIKERVTFGYLNLAEDAYPSLTNNTNAMDVIFCRNVLMYFASDPIQQVIQKFHRSLVEGGWLIVSPTETSQQLFSRFASVPFDGGTFYRKEAECGMPKAKGSAAAAAEDERRKAEGGAPVGGFEISNLEFQMPTARPPYEEARGLMAEGNYAEAARRLEEVPGPLQDTAEYWTLQARTCANLGHLAEARRWAEKALAADKLNAGMHYLRAMIVQEQGAAEEASGSLKRALYLDPRFVLAHFALANLELRRRRQREADRHFTNTLRLLDHYQDDEVLPQSEGLAAGRLRDLVRSTLSIERAA